MFGSISLSDKEFEAISALVYDKFGINLTDQKRSLVIGRLQKLMRAKGLDSFQGYLDYIEADTSHEALGELIDRISTNHTFFYREQDHFKFLKETVLPEVVKKANKKGSKDIRIWCAGCSTGEEAYTLAIVLKEFFGLDLTNWSAGLLATDISKPALEAAMAGVYVGERASLIPAHIQQKYFKKNGEGQIQVKDDLKIDITFRRFNLMNPAFPFKKPFDVIFCRNVMIYFDQPTREALVSKFFNSTQPGGYLFIGHSESLRRDSCPYDYVKPAVYRKSG